MIRLFLVALLCVGLGGCPLTDGKQKIDARVSRASLPAVPPYIANCFRGVVDFAAVDTSAPELVRVLAKVRKSEAYKDQCGRRFEAWYAEVRKQYGAG